MVKHKRSPMPPRFHRCLLNYQDGLGLKTLNKRGFSSLTPTPPATSLQLKKGGKNPLVTVHLAVIFSTSTNCSLQCQETGGRTGQGMWTLSFYNEVSDHRVVSHGPLFHPEQPTSYINSQLQEIQLSFRKVHS